MSNVKYPNITGSRFPPGNKVSIVSKLLFKKFGNVTSSNSLTLRLGLAIIITGNHLPIHNTIHTIQQKGMSSVIRLAFWKIGRQFKDKKKKNSISRHSTEEYHYLVCHIFYSVLSAPAIVTHGQTSEILPEDFHELTACIKQNLVDKAMLIMDKYDPALLGRLDVDGNTLLCMAAEHGNLDMVKYLVEKCSSDIEQCGTWKPRDAGLTLAVSPFWVASRENRLEVVKYLRDKGACITAPSNTGVTPLMSACAGGSVAVVNYMLTHTGGNPDIDINSQTSDGRTALHIAIKTQFLDMIALLIQHGADVNSQNSNGSTPLHIAAQHKSSDEIELLIQHGADVNSQNSNGLTPLHIAAQHKSSDEIELLIQHGADVNSQNSNGSTPLHIAAQHKSSDEIELLIQHGADVNSQNSNGWTPLHIAASAQVIRRDRTTDPTWCRRQQPGN